MTNGGLAASVLSVNGTTSATFGCIISDGSHKTALVKAGAGTLTLTGTNTYSGTTTISAGTVSIGNGTTDGSIAGSSGIANNAAVIFNLVGAQTYGNVISGSGTLTKSGAGTLTLSNTNTYSGATTVSSGTLLVTGSTHASSAVTVSSGAALGGSGTVNGTLSTANGSTLNAGTGGSSIGTLTLSNVTPYTATATTTLAMEVTNATSDQLRLSGATGSVDVSAIQLALTVTTPSAYPYTLIDCPLGTLTGSFASISGVPGGSPAVNVLVTAHAVVLTQIAAPTVLSPVDNSGNVVAIHTLNRRPALIWSVPQAADALHFRVFLDQGAGTTQLADSGVSLSGFAYWNGSTWSALTAAAPASDGTMRVRWTPTSDIALGRNFWAVNAVDSGNTTPTAAVRSFRIETPPWAGDTTLASGKRIRAVHIEQLRTEANDVRSFRNEGVIYVFAPVVFTDPTLTTNVTQIRKVHRKPPMTPR